jgi:hypothetical protein
MLFRVLTRYYILLCIFILTVKENTEVFSFCDEFDKNNFTKKLKMR